MSQKGLEVRALSQAKEERIAGLSADLTRVTDEHAAGLTELHGLRKDLLMQIELARGEARHWQTVLARVDAENKLTVQTYREKAASYENDLSGLRGRMGAIEDLLAASQLRCGELEADLTVAKT